MADLLFTAGLDDRGFKTGMKGLVRQSSDVGGVISRVAKIGFGVLGAATVVSGLRKLWREAGEAVRDYGKDNMFAARTIAEIDRAFHGTEMAAGRLFTSMLREGKAMLIELAEFFSGTFDWMTDTLFGEGTAKKMKAEEAATKAYNQEKIIRDTGGPVQEDILRLQGHDAAADLLRAQRKAVDEQRRLRDLLRDKKIEQPQFDELFDLINKRMILEGGEALKRGSRSFGGDVPRALRAAMQGPRNEDVMKQVLRAGMTGNVILKKIEKNTSKTRPPVYN